MPNKETTGKLLDRWKKEASDNAAIELRCIDLQFPGLPEDLRVAIFQGLINTHRFGHALGRKEIGH